MSTREIIDLTGPASPARFGPPELIDLTAFTPEADRRPVRLFSLRDGSNIEPIETPIALARVLADDVSLPTLPTTLEMDTSPMKRARIDDNDTSFDYSDDEEEPIHEPYPNRIWQAVGEEKYN